MIAEDGEKALRLFQADQYAVLLLDVMMPKMDGFPACGTFILRSSARRST